MAAARLTLRITLGAYVAFLAVVGFYPSPVDCPVHELLMHAIHVTQQHGLHFITYPSVEFTANILLFVHASGATHWCSTRGLPSAFMPTLAILAN